MLAPRRRWQALGRRLDAEKGKWAQIFTEIGQRYGEPGRYYHTLAHLHHMFALLDELPPGLDSPTLQLAIWFHDLVYDPHRNDNEEESARLADLWLSPFLPPAQLPVVCNLILATKHHRCSPADERCAALIDLDLAILGAETAVYEEYARAIRQEYAYVPEEAYRVGRMQVLQAFEERPFIYNTAPMRQRYEHAARQNIQAEIARLA